MGELLVLYGLERTLDRLTRTPFADAFVLKGGVLLAAFDQRRVTRDIDLQARSLEVSSSRMTSVVEAIAQVDADDGLEFVDLNVEVDQIREDDEYEGLRVVFRGALGTAKIRVQLDVSTGDPIVPGAQEVLVPGLLGEDVKIMGHPMVTVIAEKTVTILQRGTTSTRWRDYVDVVNLARTHPFKAGELRNAAKAVARHRDVVLGPVAPAVDGYGDVGQAKWMAWRKKNELQERCEALLDDQMAALARFVDPVYTGDATNAAMWDPDRRQWNEP